MQINELLNIDYSLIKTRILFFRVFLIPLINDELADIRYFVRLR